MASHLLRMFQTVECNDETCGDCAHVENGACVLFGEPVNIKGRLVRCYQCKNADVFPVQHLDRLARPRAVKQPSAGRAAEMPGFPSVRVRGAPLTIHERTPMRNGTTPRPPSPEYYRRFVAGWCGGVSPACRFMVVAGASRPKKTGDDEITVGDDWLAKECVPRAALEEAHG